MRSPEPGKHLKRNGVMNILALNPGSATLRYKLLAIPRDGEKACEKVVRLVSNV